MVKSIRFLWKIMLMTIILAMFSGCGSKTAPRHDSEEEGEELIQIGMIFDNFVMERWERDRDVFVSTAKELGAEVNVQNANSSVEEQADLMEYFIKKKVDAIVIVPIDSAPLVSSVKKAQDAGIKVICYDRIIVGARPDLYISFDNEMVGSIMGNLLSARLGVGDKVLMISGPITDHNVEEVNNGFIESMQEKNIEILDIYYAEEWKPEYASAYVRQHSDLLGQIKGIMCGNDSLAGQAIVALAEQRLAGDIYVAGQDADLSACQRIVEGTQYMTVYKQVEKLAVRAAQATVSLVNGEVLKSDFYTTEDGNEVPYIKMEPIGVTSLNINAVIIDSGFHLKEDVYLNRPELLE